MTSTMTNNLGSEFTVRVVPDPANRKTRTWQLSFARGAAGHIIKKHVTNCSEPWGAAIDRSLLASLKGTAKTGTDRQALKETLLDHAEITCQRPQAMLHDEREDLYRSESIRCCLLVCRCGLLIAIRNIDVAPKIHTAFFRRGIVKTGSADHWKSLVRDLRNEHVVADRQSGKLAYPTPDVFKEIDDEENSHRKYWRTRIEFHSKYTWGFKEQDGVWLPIGEIPNWQESKV